MTATRGRMLRPDDGRRANAGPRNQQWKGDAIGYRGAHLRVARVRGRADTHPCVECGVRAVGRAMHWSLPPDAKRRQVDARLGLTYSPDPGDYDVRCRQDHVDRDRIVRTGNGPRLVEIAGWILGALEDAGGRIATRDVYRLGEAAGIDPRMLTAARTWYLDVLRPAGVVAARERRKRRGGLRARPGAFRSVLCTVSHVGASTPPTTEATPKEVTKW